MKETKPYWYPDTAYSIAAYFICLHFPDLMNLSFDLFLFDILLRSTEQAVQFGRYNPGVKMRSKCQNSVQNGQYTSKQSVTFTPNSY